MLQIDQLNLKSGEQDAHRPDFGGQVCVLGAHRAEPYRARTPCVYSLKPHSVSDDRLGGSFIF